MAAKIVRFFERLFSKLGIAHGPDLDLEDLAAIFFVGQIAVPVFLVAVVVGFACGKLLR
jgi:hypothetical protein